MKALSCLDKYAKYQPLFLRVMLIFVIVAHGRSKLTGGIDAWTGLGSAMGVRGIDVLPAVWGFLAAYAESIGIVLIVLGLFTRYHAFLLAFTMLTAITMKLTGEPGIERLGELSAAVYIFTVSFALMLTGAGPVANLEQLIWGKEI